jgi:hypothetical protein
MMKNALHKVALLSCVYVEALRRADPPSYYYYYYYYPYYLIELQMRLYPVAVALQKDRTKEYTYHTKEHTRLKKNTTHKATKQ